MGREGLENHLRQRYKDNSIAVTVDAPYLIVSCHERLNMFGGGVYSDISNWFRRKGADLPIKTFGPSTDYGIRPEAGFKKYIFQLYREAFQFLA